MFCCAPAQVFPMSILACLGSDAEALRDIFLNRLAATTEDVQLKVVIVSFLSICVETQPGLVEIFLNLTPDTTKKVTSPDKKEIKGVGDPVNQQSLAIIDSCILFYYIRGLKSHPGRSKDLKSLPPSCVKKLYLWGAHG